MSGSALGLVAAGSLHTLIYGVMSVSILTLLYVGATGADSRILWIVEPLLAAEVVVFAANGFRCPVTAIVDRCAGASSRVSDTYLPERWTRHTLAIFGPLLGLAVLLVAARSLGVIGASS